MYNFKSSDSLYKLRIVFILIQQWAKSNLSKAKIWTTHIKIVSILFPVSNTSWNITHSHKTTSVFIVQLIAWKSRPLKYHQSLIVQQNMYNLVSVSFDFTSIVINKWTRHLYYTHISTNWFLHFIPNRIDFNTLKVFTIWLQRRQTVNNV